MSGSLVDSYARTIDYLRVSITDLCNLRCLYCRPPEGVKLITHEEILRYEEILALIGAARDLGIRKIRITGGEPLVRRGVLGFLAGVTSLKGIEDVGLTTNGVLLAAMAKDLRTAGLKRVNISLDSLRGDVFARITGADMLQQVLKGIDAALEEGFDPVKINVVLLRGVNEPDIPAFGKLTMDRPLDVRFIERMPFGGETLPQSPEPFSAITALDMIRSTLGELVPQQRDRMDGPASMFKLRGAKGRIGIIDPVTGHFCGTCNRLRLTARGTLRPCLMGSHEIDVKGPLRAGASRKELAEIIRQAAMAKPGCHPWNIPQTQENMNLIGG
jgi:GTP 3',8-cyclase